MNASAKGLGKFTKVISSLSPSLRVRLTSQPVACLGIRTFFHCLGPGNVCKTNWVMVRSRWRLFSDIGWAELVSMGNENNVYQIPSPFKRRERRGDNRSQRSFLNWIDQLGQVKANCQTSQSI